MRAGWIVLAAACAAAAAEASERPEGAFQVAYFRPGPDWLRGPGGLDRLFDAARPAPPPRERTPAAALATKAAGRRELSVLRAAAAAPQGPKPGLLIPIPTSTRPYRKVFQRLLGDPGRTDRYDSIILRHAQRLGLDPRLLKAVIAAESEFSRTALSRSGARGLMQLMGPTARAMGVAPSELSDPEQNIKAGAAYLKHLFERAWRRFKLEPRLPFSRAPLWLTQRVLAAYNAGPRFLTRRALWRETREYLKKVILFMKSPLTQLRREPLAPGPALPTPPPGTL